MIAVDTNILVYAHRAGSSFHAAARRCVIELAEGRATWAVPWPCLHEFLCVVTHPRVFRPPTPLEEALGQVTAWLGSPSLVVLAEAGEYWPTLTSMVTAGRASGTRLYDARIAALCRLHGVRELWTADRDFTRFPELTVFNPLVAGEVHESAPADGAHRRARAAGKRHAARARQPSAHP